MIRCIAAIDEKLGLATDKGIPWNLPTDRHFFAEQTVKGSIVMGMGTYKEFTKPMHGHTNYVATRSDEKLLPGFIGINDVPKFLEEHEDEVINIIGGAGLFETTIEFADELVLTLVQADFHCTKFFPEYENNFVCASKSNQITENDITFYFTDWIRKD